MNIVEMHTATMLFEDDGVVLIKFKDGIKLGVEEVKEIVDETIDLVEGQRYRSLVDARDIFAAMNSKARNYLIHHKEINRLTIAQAIVLNNIAIRLLAQIYISLNRAPIPIRMFTNIDVARAWLMKQS